MPRPLTTAFVIGLAATASAASASSSVTSSANLPSGSVVSIFLLDQDSQSLVASRIASSNGLETLAIQCSPGAATSICDYPTPIIVTAGSSTVSASANFEGLVAQYGCQITGSTTGFCSITYVGDAADFATDDAQASTLSGITTISTSGALDSTDITFFPVTITAGQGIGGAAGAASPTATASSGSAGGSSSSRGSSSGSGSSSSATASSSSSSSSSSATKSGANNTSSSPVSSKTGAAGKLAVPGLAGLAVLALAAFL